MIKNYLKIALRNIWKHKGYTAINVLGLAGSAAICILIIFYVISVLTYDQFHSDADRIFFMYRDRATETGRIPVYDTWYPMADAAKNDYAVVESGTRYFTAGNTWVRQGDKRFEQQVSYCDTTFFEFFDFPLTRGDRNTMLDDPNSVVISEEVAQKFFGDQDPIGQVLNFGFSQDRTVTGVFGRFPGNSSFTFECVVPLNDRLAASFLGDNLWGGSFCTSFVKLKNAADITTLRDQANAIIEKYATEAERGNVLFLPLEDYNNEFTDQRKYAYTLLIVAIGILLIAAINFTNLATAQSLLRTKEVGVRKVMGATKGRLVNQFLGESMLVVFFALILGGLGAELLLPYFSNMIGLQIDYHLVATPQSFIIILLLGIVMGILSGSYPSFYMSSFKPSEILKGSQSKGGSMLIRNGLVILQFALAIILLSAVVIIENQVQYMKGSDLKFDRDNVVVIPLGVRDFEDRDHAIARIVSFKEELKQLPGVISVTASNGIPGNAPGNFSLFLPEGKEDINPLDYRVASVEDDYFDTYGLKLIAGRNFIPNSISDRENSIILNQSAVRDIGWENAVGRKLLYPRSRRPIEIIGVVEDFNYESLKQPVLPLVHYYGGDSARNYRFISVKLEPNARAAALNLMAQTWQKMNFSKAYEYFFPAEQMETLYEAEENLIRILSNATLFAMFIACLGLYSLASFTVMLRTKEIAIRKVLGASVGSILGLFTRKYLSMILIALLVAVPLAWYGMTQWLQGFAYRVEIQGLVFLLTGAVAVVIAFITVGFHSVRAGFSNPVKSLRSE